MPTHETLRRTRNREHDAKRRTENPWRAWYATKQWRSLRAAQLRAEPFCAMCQPTLTVATVCDHVRPHKGDPALFWSGPFQSLCKLHHDSTKQREEKSGRAARPIGADGWPIE